MCLLLTMTVIHNTAQNSSDIFRLILQTIITAQILSTGREGKSFKKWIHLACITIQLKNDQSQPLSLRSSSYESRRGQLQLSHAYDRLMRQLIVASRHGRTEYQLLPMKISWWDRNVKIRYKCFVVIDEFLSVWRGKVYSTDSPDSTEAGDASHLTDIHLTSQGHDVNSWTLTWFHFRQRRRRCRERWRRNRRRCNGSCRFHLHLKANTTRARFSMQLRNTAYMKIGINQSQTSSNLSLTTPKYNLESHHLRSCRPLYHKELDKQPIRAPAFAAVPQWTGSVANAGIFTHCAVAGFPSFISTF